MIDSSTIEKLIEKAQEEKSKLKPDALYSILTASKMNRLKTPKLSNSGTGKNRCCNSCGDNDDNRLIGQGPYLILRYVPEADRWEAQSTKNSQEIFLGSLTFPGLVAPGFILPGWHNIGEPYGILQPKISGKRFESYNKKDKDKFIEITINLNIGFTGRG